jgi:hypothetical protein
MSEVYQSVFTSVFVFSHFRVTDTNCISTLIVYHMCTVYRRTVSTWASLTLIQMYQTGISVYKCEYQRGYNAPLIKTDTY